MFIFTNRSAVDAVYNNKAPRDVSDIMREAYPDATIDCEGRFHAPCDGYQCRLTDKVFRGGEYLPMSDECMQDASWRSVQARDAITGEVVTWEGTAGQIAAVRTELREQTNAYDKALSDYIAPVGEKVTIRVTIEAVFDYQSVYGTVFRHLMKDERGNVIVYKGGKLLAIGDKPFTVTAKVKRHDTYNDVRQTVIERPKVAA